MRPEEERPPVRVAPRGSEIVRGYGKLRNKAAQTTGNEHRSESFRHIRSLNSLIENEGDQDGIVVSNADHQGSRHPEHEGPDGRRLAPKTVAKPQHEGHGAERIDVRHRR